MYELVLHVLVNTRANTPMSVWAVAACTLTAVQMRAGCYAISR